MNQKTSNLKIDPNPNNKNKVLPKILICIPLWGANYCKKATRYLIPSLFSSNNLSYLRSNYNFLVKIYTDTESFASVENLLTNSPLLKKNYSVVDFFKNEAFDHKGDKYGGLKYDRVTLAQKDAGLLVKKSFDYMIPIYGDFMVSDFFFQKAMDKMSVDISCILSLVPPVVTEQMEALYKTAKILDPRTPLSRIKLEEIGIKNMHPLMRLSIFKDKDQFRPIGPYLGLENNDGLVFCSMHYHPVVLSAKAFKNNNCTFQGTIDEKWLQEMKLNKKNTLFFNVYRDFPLISLMDNDFPLPNTQGVLPKRFFSNMIRRQTDLKTTLFFLKNKVIFSPTKRSHKDFFQLISWIDDFFNEITPYVRKSQNNPLFFTEVQEDLKTKTLARKGFIHLIFLRIFYFFVKLFPKKFRRNIYFSLPYDLKEFLTT